MNIRGKELNPEQERKWNDAMKQLADELEQVSSHDKTVTQPNDSFVLNCKQANKPYDEIKKKYWAILDDILAESGGDENS